MNNIKELKYGNTRCYCINNTILVDTDWAGTLPAFYKCVKENSIDLKSIRFLLLTHFHPDHMGIAQELGDIGIKIVVFEEQREYVHFSDKIFEKDKSIQFKPIDDDTVIYMACSDSRRFLLENGVDGEVIHTIGHSEDSISVILDEGIAIVGDLPPLYSVPAYNDLRLEESWHTILSKGVKRVYYGHAQADILSKVTSIRDIVWRI